MGLKQSLRVVSWLLFIPFQFHKCLLSNCRVTVVFLGNRTLAIALFPNITYTQILEIICIPFTCVSLPITTGKPTELIFCNQNLICNPLGTDSEKLNVIFAPFPRCAYEYMSKNKALAKSAHFAVIFVTEVVFGVKYF